MTDSVERDLLDALRAEAYREPLLLDASTLRERLDRRPRRRGILMMAALKPAAAVVAGLATVAAIALITHPAAGPGISPSSSPAVCSVTRPAQPFAAPSPFPAAPPNAAEAWFGSDVLWTMLNRHGEVWHQSGQAAGLSQKTFWWSKDWVPRAEPAPAITVILTRLDGDGSYSFGPGTNASSADLGGTAMLVGVDFPGPGCWQLTAHYRGAALSYVVWIKND